MSRFGFLRSGDVAESDLKATGTFAGVDREVDPEVQLWEMLDLVGDRAVELLLCVYRDLAGSASVCIAPDSETSQRTPFTETPLRGQRWQQLGWSEYVR